MTPTDEGAPTAAATGRHAEQLSRRYEAETDRLDAERDKLKSEHREIERRLRLRWYRSTWFLQAVTAGLVAVPLISFYVKDYALPLWSADVARLTRVNEETALALSRKTNEYEAKNAELSARAIRLEQAKNEIQAQYTRLTAQKETEVKRYRIDLTSAQGHYDELASRWKAGQQRTAEAESRYIAARGDAERVSGQLAAAQKELAELKAQSPQRSAAGMTKPDGTMPSAGFSGKLISLNLIDTDINQVFRVFHDASGEKFEVGADVVGKVTVVVDKVPWDLALNIVLQNNALTAERTWHISSTPHRAPARVTMPQGLIRSDFRP